MLSMIRTNFQLKICKWIFYLIEEKIIFYTKRSNGISPRVNFDTFFSSVKTIFILLTNESWNIIMYDHIRAMGIEYSLFFIFVVIFGNYILLKLFIAILIYNFAEATIKHEKEKILNKSNKILKLTSNVF